MIIGAHSIIYSSKSDEDRAFLRDVLGLSHVDVGGGWLIFGLPPAEVAVHPQDSGGVMHEFFLMCDDVQSFIAEMATRNVSCTPVQDQDWGLLTQITLPGGAHIGVYQPRHQRPPAMRATADSADTAENPTVVQRARKLVTNIAKRLGGGKTTKKPTKAPTKAPAKKPAKPLKAAAKATPSKKAGKPGKKPGKPVAKKSPKKGR
jgi:hypothetical protein